MDIQFGSTAGTVNNVGLIAANDNPALANTTEVETGSTVNGIYLKVEGAATSSAALPNWYMMVVKNPGGNLVFPAPNVVGASDNKKYVIHQEMVMLQKQTGSNPRTLFNGVIRIPKGYKRFGPNDTLVVTTLAPDVTMDQCIQCHYKEFR